MTPAFGLFANPESRRVEGFCAALVRRLGQRPLLLPWQRVLDGPPWQQMMEAAPRYLRLESPGRNWPVEKKLLLRGATVEDEEAERGWRSMPAGQLFPLDNDPGRVLSMRQWFLGWRAALRDVSRWAQEHGFTPRWLCPPEDVICMFDKLACQGELEKSGLAVPPTLGLPRNFDELWETMRQAGRKRLRSRSRRRRRHRLWQCAFPHTSLSALGTRTPHASHSP